MLHEYETYLQEKGFSPNTVISYLNDVNQFLKDLHLRPGDYVTSADIRKWIQQMLNPAEGKPLGHLHDQSPSEFAAKLLCVGGQTSI
jgi:site-specific recombinase XerD